MEKDIVKHFFTGTGSSYDSIVNLFTYGADRYWKKKLLAKVPKSRKILDLACGTGIVAFKLAKMNPCCKIVGVDMMWEYLVEAKKKAFLNDCSEVQLICARAEDVKLRETFDCVTSSYIPKYVPADVLLKNISLNLKSGGVLVLHDFAYPSNFVFKRLWHLHMFFMKIIGTTLFPKWRNVFDELAPFVKNSRWIPEYLEALKRFGFIDIQLEKYTAGSAAIISAVKQ